MSIFLKGLPTNVDMSLATIQGGPFDPGTTAYITSLYGYRDPIQDPDTGLWFPTWHTGLDMSVWPVVSGVYKLHALWGGTVNHVDGTNDDNGYSVSVLSDDGQWYFEYYHLSDPPLVVPGQLIGAGKLLGYEGTTGYSTGPHLHLGIMYQWSYVDPLPVLSMLRDLGELVPGSGYFDVENRYHDEFGWYSPED